MPTATQDPQVSEGANKALETAQQVLKPVMSAAEFDQVAAKTAFASITAVIDGNAVDSEKITAIQNIQENVKDTSLEAFAGVAKAIVGSNPLAEDASNKKTAALKDLTKEFEFINDDKLSNESRIQKTLAAPESLLLKKDGAGNYVKSENGPVMKDDSELDPNIAQSIKDSLKTSFGKFGEALKAEANKFREAEPQQPSSAETNASQVEDEQSEKPKVRTKQDWNERSYKAAAIQCAKGAVAVGLVCGLPGFGFILAAAFLVATRNIGVSPEEEVEKDEEYSVGEQYLDESNEWLEGYLKSKQSPEVEVEMETGAKKDETSAKRSESPTTVVDPVLDLVSPLPEANSKLNEAETDAAKAKRAERKNKKNNLDDGLGDNGIDELFNSSSDSSAKLNSEKKIEFEDIFGDDNQGSNENEEGITPPLNADISTQRSPELVAEKSVVQPKFKTNLETIDEGNENEDGEDDVPSPKQADKSSQDVDLISSEAVSNYETFPALDEIYSNNKLLKKDGVTVEANFENVINARGDGLIEGGFFVRGAKDDSVDAADIGATTDDLSYAKELAKKALEKAHLAEHDGSLSQSAVDDLRRKANEYADVIDESSNDGGGNVEVVNDNKVPSFSDTYSDLSDNIQSVDDEPNSNKLRPEDQEHENNAENSRKLRFGASEFKKTTGKQIFTEKRRILGRSSVAVDTNTTSSVLPSGAAEIDADTSPPTHVGEVVAAAAAEEDEGLKNSQDNLNSVSAAVGRLNSAENSSKASVQGWFSGLGSGWSFSGKPKSAEKSVGIPEEYLKDMSLDDQELTREVNKIKLAEAENKENGSQDTGNVDKALKNANDIVKSRLEKERLGDKDLIAAVKESTEAFKKAEVSFQDAGGSGPVVSGAAINSSRTTVDESQR